MTRLQSLFFLFALFLSVNASAQFSTINLDTVNIPRTVFAEKSGALKLIAEKGTGIGLDIAYMPEWRAFGWFTASSRVEWYVVVEKGGTYDVTLEWSVSDEESGKGFVIEFGPQTVKGKVGKSGSWETFKTVSVGHVKLAAGSHRVVFRPSVDFGLGAILDLREIRLNPAQ
ncbi:hypothetical protein [Flavihumibacter sp. UBA7668]|uniref:hypothetical protein n=1 Tax=Flavihumibacter sp. UBA7668 TaxID=1946542 RepID=UPI0025BB6556|nr:hypothetical protein [Flavihumibacter sp. UBA7668]